MTTSSESRLQASEASAEAQTTSPLNELIAATAPVSAAITTLGQKISAKAQRGEIRDILALSEDDRVVTLTIGEADRLITAVQSVQQASV